MFSHWKVASHDLRVRYIISLINILITKISKNSMSIVLPPFFKSVCFFKYFRRLCIIFLLNQLFWLLNQLIQHILFMSSWVEEKGAFDDFLKLIFIFFVIRIEPYIWNNVLLIQEKQSWTIIHLLGRALITL